MKIYIFPTIKLLMSLTILSICIACTSHSDTVNEPANPSESLAITINADGTTSTGAIFAPVSDDSFYLDYVLYKIVDSHLEIVRVDETELKSNIKIYSPVNYWGTTYNVRKIRRQAFYGTDIETIVLPDEIREIETCAFTGCYKLKQINLPKELRYISESCFDGCRNLSISYIPNKIEYIGSWAFTECTFLENIQIPGTCERIYEKAFNKCVFKDLTIADGVKYMYYEAFVNCKIQNLYLPPTLIYFYRSDLPSYRLTHWVFHNAEIENAEVGLSHWLESEIKDYFYEAKISNFNIF